MDAGTRNVLFESMRKRQVMRSGRGGGALLSVQRLATLKSNRKLFLEHRQLEKQCAATIRQYWSDTKVIQAQLHIQKFEVQKKQERLSREQTTIQQETEKRHRLLNTIHANHCSVSHVMQPSTPNKFQLEHALANSAKLLRKSYNKYNRDVSSKT